MSSPFWRQSLSGFEGICQQHCRKSLRAFLWILDVDAEGFDQIFIRLRTDV